ncbi:MAG: hypothetical protein WAO76_06925, partial [Georgfuchsia sp.]
STASAHYRRRKTMIINSNQAQILSVLSHVVDMKREDILSITKIQESSYARLSLDLKEREFVLGTRVGCHGIVRMRLLPLGFEALDRHNSKQLVGVKVESGKINLMAATEYKSVPAYCRNDGNKSILSLPGGFSC